MKRLVFALIVFCGISYAQNSMNVSQQALEDNYLLTEQLGNHQLLLNTLSSTGSNISNVSQMEGSSIANIQQIANGDNIIPDAFSSDPHLSNSLGYSGIYQKGSNNVIAGADLNSGSGQPVLINDNIPAIQNSMKGSNWLQVWQVGDDNTVGLYQGALSDNTALIDQQNDNNKLAVFQENFGGKNYLFFQQMGDKSATVKQLTTPGAVNAIIVIQRK